jgi:hypothetical protein
MDHTVHDDEIQDAGTITSQDSTLESQENIQEQPNTGPHLFTLDLYVDPNKTCCVCCADKSIVGIVDTYGGPTVNRDAQLMDIYPSQFVNNVLPAEIMFLGSCGKHYLCIECMREIINNYENHPINENNSHFACPSPFEECVTSIGFKNVFDHNQIQKICRTTQEWENYSAYAQQYAFPGYTIISCPISLRTTNYNPVLCNAPVLIETVEFRERAVGDLVIECSQNEDCLKRFCYYCRKVLSYHEEQCNQCKLTYENENPNVLNYYFNKHSDPIAQVNGGEEDDNLQNVLHFEETDYLYFNKDITVQFAVDYITETIQNHHSHMICPVCKISLYKTERCNGLSHHRIERCYACGRVGFKVRGLGNHWDAGGHDGCYRFDSERFVTHYIPDYNCTDSMCSDHDKGDCQDPEHQNGIQRLEYTRKRAYVYHLLKSLLPTIRYTVYDRLIDEHIDDDAFIEYLPYKQTLLLLDHFKEHTRDYYEDIVYDQLKCHLPHDIPSFANKKTVIEATDYVLSYSWDTTRAQTPWSPQIIRSPSPSHPNQENSFDFENSPWRRLFENPLQPDNHLNWLTESSESQRQLVSRTLVERVAQENSMIPDSGYNDTLETIDITDYNYNYNYDLLPSITVTSPSQWDDYWSPLLSTLATRSDIPQDSESIHQSESIEDVD